MSSEHPTCLKTRRILPSTWRSLSGYFGMFDHDQNNEKYIKIKLHLNDIAMLRPGSMEIAGRLENLSENENFKNYLFRGCFVVHPIFCRFLRPYSLKKRSASSLMFIGNDTVRLPNESTSGNPLHPTWIVRRPGGQRGVAPLTMP